MLFLRRPSAARLETALAAARQEQPAYDGVGSTAPDSGTPIPGGYRQSRDQLHLGHGDAVFARAAEAVHTLQAQRSIGTTLIPPEAVAEPGTTVVQCIRMGPLWALAACRIVYRIEEPDRIGFAYGSLSEHPVRGEEAFLVERDPTGTVRARIVVFSRPRHWLVRLGGPIGRLVQRRTARAYLRGIRAYAVPS